MKKGDILKALESVGNSTESNIVTADLVRNIQIFGDEVIVDAESMSPTLQAKKKLEVDIMKAIHDKVAEKAKVVVNVSVSEKSKETAANVIKGAPIPSAENFVRCLCANPPMWATCIKISTMPGNTSFCLALFFSK